MERLRNEHKSKSQLLNINRIRKMKTILTFFLAILFIYTQAQDGGQSYNSNNSGTFNSNTNEVDKFLNKIESIYRYGKAGDKYKNVLGSPYLKEEFSNGNIFKADGQVLKNIPLRFNAYNGEMEVVVNEVSYQIPVTEFVSYVTMDGMRFDRVDYKLTSKKQNGYLELVIDGKLKLYRKHMIYYKEAHSPSAMQAHATLPELKPISPKYLIMAKGADVASAFVSKKDFQKLLPENQDEILSFMKENKLKPKKEEDLIQIVNYYNSL